MDAHSGALPPMRSVHSSRGRTLTPFLPCLPSSAVKVSGPIGGSSRPDHRTIRKHIYHIIFKVNVIFKANGSLDIVWKPHGESRPAVLCSFFKSSYAPFPIFYHVLDPLPSHHCLEREMWTSCKVHSFHPLFV